SASARCATWRTALMSIASGDRCGSEIPKAIFFILVPPPRGRYHAALGRRAMPTTITPSALAARFDGRAPFALVDVREAGEYNSSHIPGATPMPRRQLEVALPHAVPFLGTPVVLCDDDGRRAHLAAATVERLGYRDVSVLDGGINRWVTDGLATEWGTNVPSKDFGEK